jgi:hypothetical protein
VAEAINAGNVSVQKHKIHERAGAAGDVVTPYLMYILILKTALFEETLGGWVTKSIKCYGAVLEY